MLPFLLMKAENRTLFALFTLGLALAGCGWWTQAKSAAAEQAGIDAGLCVLQQVEAGQTDPKSIAIMCAIEDVQNVVKIITAHYRIVARHALDTMNAPAASAAASASGGK